MGSAWLVPSGLCSMLNPHSVLNVHERILPDNIIEMHSIEDKRVQAIRRCWFLPNLLAFMAEDRLPVRKGL